MTNFWIGIPVEQLCDQHLLGLHKEIHQEAGTIKNHPYGEAILTGHWRLGQASTDKITERHEKVVQEMDKRGMSHDSELDYTDTEGFHTSIIGFDVEKLNRVSLASRCDKCEVKTK